MAHDFKPFDPHSGHVMHFNDGCGCGPIKPPHNAKPDNAVYPTKDNLSNLGINHNPLSNGQFEFPRSVEQELVDWGSGGNPEGLLPSLAATDLAQILFMPPTQESMNFDFSNTPWMSLNGVNKRVIPLDIRTVLQNTPIAYPLFRPTRVGPNGFYSFRYIGKYPIHGLMQGSMNVLVRVHPTLDQGYNRLILSLDPLDGMDFIEEGQGNGKRFLANSSGLFDQRRLVNGLGGVTNTYLDVTDNFMEGIAAVGQRYVGSLPGYFRASTPDDQLEHFNTGSTVPLGPEVRSTAWFSVENMDPATEGLVFWTVTGSSNRGRIRVKDAAGTITYLADESSDRTANRIFRIPVGSVQAQIYYSGPGNEAPAETNDNILIKRVPAGNLSLLSTLRGYWVQKFFHVHREITLIPGTEYTLNFLSNVFDGATNVSYGFRYEGGGFSLTFDAGWLRKEMAKNLFGAM